MFSGIVRAFGVVRACDVNDSGLRLALDMPLQGVAAGDSIAVNGACLTVCALTAAAQFDISPETLSKTLISTWQAGQRVNVEPALTLADKLDGHLVFGHVDGIAHVTARQTHGECVEFWLRLPRALGKLLAVKGSVALDGISLTINEVRDDGDDTEFRVMLVAHTLNHTTAQHWQAGQPVHIEADMLARYVARQLQGAAR